MICCLWISLIRVSIGCEIFAIIFGWGCVQEEERGVDVRG